MIIIGEIYRTKDTPTRFAIIEDVNRSGIFYRVLGNLEHYHCSLDEVDFLYRYFKVKGLE